MAPAAASAATRRVGRRPRAWWGSPRPDGPRWAAAASSQPPPGWRPAAARRGARVGGRRHRVGAGTGCRVRGGPCRGAAARHRRDAPSCRAGRSGARRARGRPGRGWSSPCDRALRTWLRAVRDTTGAASVRELLGPVAAPAFGARRARCRPSGAMAAVLRTGPLVAAGRRRRRASSCGCVADAPLLARAGIALVAVGAGACVLVLALLPALLRGIERREHLAAPPDPDRPPRAAAGAARGRCAGVAAGLGALSLVVLAAASVDPVRLAVSGCWPAETDGRATS